VQTQPRWRTLQVGGSPVAIRHERLSTETRDFDLMPDGRLLLTTPGDESGKGLDTSPQIRIVLNWFEELKRLTPVQSSLL